MIRDNDVLLVKKVLEQNPAIRSNLSISKVVDELIDLKTTETQGHTRHRLPSRREVAIILRRLKS